MWRLKDQIFILNNCTLKPKKSWLGMVAVTGWMGQYYYFKIESNE